MTKLITQYELETDQVSLVDLIDSEYSDRYNQELSNYFDFIRSQLPPEKFEREKESIDNDNYKMLLLKGHIMAKITQDLLKEKEILIPGVNCLEEYPAHLTVLGRN